MEVGNLSKMVTEATSPVSYSLPLSQTLVPLNAFLGKTLKLHYQQKINCICCKKAIKKSYQDGYCFPCTQTLAQSDLCIVKPERCHYLLGTCREPSWGEKHCMAPHIVYLANASGIKVGITRKSNLPTRWIDQGAIAALPLYEVSSRRISGYVEVALAKHLADKTNWRKMLTGQDDSINLETQSKNAFNKIEKEVAELLKTFNEASIKYLNVPKVERFTYPILEYPTKITSLSFDKTPLIEGTLLGIKGQYLIFDRGVLNIRKHSGYVVAILA